MDSGLLLPAPQSSQTHVMGSIQDREWLSTSSAPAFFSLLLGLLWPGRRKEWAEAGGQNKAEAEPSPPGCSLCLFSPTYSGPAVAGPQDWMTPGVVNKSHTLRRWGTQDTPSHTRIFMVLEHSTHSHRFRPLPVLSSQTEMSFEANSFLPWG